MKKQSENNKKVKKSIDKQKAIGYNKDNKKKYKTKSKQGGTDHQNIKLRLVYYLNKLNNRTNQSTKAKTKENQI